MDPHRVGKDLCQFYKQTQRGLGSDDLAMLVGDDASELPDQRGYLSEAVPLGLVIEDDH